MCLTFTAYVLYQQHVVVVYHLLLIKTFLPFIQSDLHCIQGGLHLYYIFFISVLAILNP